VEQEEGRAAPGSRCGLCLWLSVTAATPEQSPRVVRARTIESDAGGGRCRVDTGLPVKTVAALILVVSTIVLAAAPGGARGRGSSGHHHGGHHHPHRGHHGRAFVVGGLASLDWWNDDSTPLSYWYCPSAGAYYPSVQSCQGPWLPVETR
jgi:hypothetical protein